MRHALHPIRVWSATFGDREKTIRSPGLLEERIDELRREVAQLLSQPGDLRDGLARLLDRLNAIAAPAGGAAESTIPSSEARIDEVLDVLYGLAGLDFTRRAQVYGHGPLDALSQTANMLAEELEATQHEMEAARAAAEAATLAKSQFLAHMSHEIRTPLTALIGFADLLSAPSVSESERLNYAMIIRRNGEHLLSVINDILDLSRIEAGRLTVEAIDCSPAQILSEVASLMRVRAKESGLYFELSLDTPIPSSMKSDPTRLRQILLNLVGNAIKFTRRGGVEVRARHEGGELAIDVIDTGIGMSAAELSTLFQPFQQADLSMTRRYGGSGLGLAISRALAEALGGRITVQSVLEHGSRFRLALPAVEAHDLVERLDERPPDRVDARRSVRLAGSVLVVEDGIDNQVLVTTLLRNYGLTVAVAGDGKVALQHALEAWRRGTPFDVILMDMQMPVMDGYQATTALRREGYPNAIIALTAHAMAGERERCLNAGCTDYLRKPIDRGELVAALTRHLPPAPLAETAPLLHSSFAADPEMVEIIVRFVASLPERVAAIRAAARGAEPDVLLRLVHQLKGAAGGYGFGEIGVRAFDVEEALRGGSEQAVVLRLIEELAELCERARAGRP
jgi:signal transduction histidine kinase/CheY-like chemotaxis protein/HPt (histidine-containing phosphotransfer) domain-containing protein